MKMNPILKKELVLGTRSIKFPIAIFFYSGSLALIALAILDGFCSTSYYYYGGVDFETLTSIFMVLAIVQLVMICIIIPILTASSIAGERERQTLDIMLTAPISPVSIVLGKLFASMSDVFLFVISSLPAMSIAFLYGGIKWQYLLIFLVSIMCIAFFSGAIGIWCSATYKKTIISVIMSMVVELLFFIGTILVIFGVYSWKYQQYLESTSTAAFSGIDVGWLPLILFLNPAVGFVDALVNAYTGTSGIETIIDDMSVNVAAGLTKLYPYWSWITLAVTLVLGALFVGLAARKIDSVRLKEKHMKKTKKVKKQKSE